MKKKKKTANLSTSNSSTELNDLKWEDLVEPYVECRDSLMNGLALASELITHNMTTINANPKLIDMSNGLAKTFEDVGEDLKALSKEHLEISETGDVTSKKHGLVAEDEVNKYLELLSGYQLVEASYATLYTNSIIPFIGALNPKEYQQAYQELKKEDASMPDTAEEFIDSATESIGVASNTVSEISKGIANGGQ